jgi:hypothetical protein
VLIITLLLGFSNKFSIVNYTSAQQSSFSGTVAGEEEDFCRCSGYQGIPVHLLLGPVIGPSSAQGKDSDPS